MGCCLSRSAATENSFPADASHVAINPSANPQDLSRVPSHPQSSNRANGGPAVKTLPNQPIRLPDPLPHSPKNVSNMQPPWTRQHLEEQRRIFFETRVSGRREVWDTLQLVCEFLHKGDVADAQAVMDAAHITCPNGVVTKHRGKDKSRSGVFDDRGKLYELPAWVVTDPQDLIDDAEEKDIDDMDGGMSDGADSCSEQHHSAAHAREEKGKGRAEDPGEHVRVTARLSNGAQDITLTTGSKQSVAALKEKIEQQHAGIRVVRLLCLGKQLDMHKSLEEQNWKPGRMLNAFVTDQAAK